MPFTLSHPAVVVALQRTGLPVTAMVIGAMSPDVPMFLPERVGYGFTHSPNGVVTADLVVSVLAVVLWSVLVRDALVDASPSPVRERLAPTSSYSRRQWLLVPIAAVVGAATHVCWDAFTHPGRWGVRHIAWLRADHLGRVGWHWGQTFSTVVGLLVVVAWAVLSLRRQTRRPRPRRVPELGELTGPAVVLVGAVVGGAAALAQVSRGFHAVAFSGAVTGTVATGAAALAVALAWRVLALRRS